MFLRILDYQTQIIDYKEYSYLAGPSGQTLENTFIIIRVNPHFTAFSLIMALELWLAGFRIMRP
jgi:hypothetical protein